MFALQETIDNKNTKNLDIGSIIDSRFNNLNSVSNNNLIKNNNKIINKLSNRSDKTNLIRSKSRLSNNSTSLTSTNA